MASRLAGKLRGIENDLRLVWAMRQLRRIDAATQPDAQVFHALRDGWGNQGWSADPAYLAAVYRMATNASGAVLECGSGVSTLLLALVAEKRRITVHSLEHMGVWSDAVIRMLRRFDLHANVYRSPLRGYEGFDWYELPASLPKYFALAVCDGPPGQTRGGRYGLMRVCRDRLRGSTILMDDAERPEEQRITEAWHYEFGTTAEFTTTAEGKYATIQVPR